MKKIFFILFLLLSIKSIGQTFPYPSQLETINWHILPRDSNTIMQKGYTDSLSSSDTVSTILQMEQYFSNPNIRNIFVTDSLRGGWFKRSSLALPDSGTVFYDFSLNQYWVRQFDRSYGVNGQWFGMDPTLTNDCSFPFMAACAYCLRNNAMPLNLPQGAYKFLEQVWIGGGTANSGNTSGFIIRGIGKNSTGTTSAGGVVLSYMGSTGAHFINFGLSVYKYFNMRDLSINCRTQNGANILLNWPSSTFTQFRFDNVSLASADTLVAIQDSTGSNGEFTIFNGCNFLSASSISFYQNSVQAFAPRFLNSSFQPMNGSTVFYMATNVGGQVDNCSISFSGSASSSPNTLLQIGGPNTDVMSFISGRYEGVDRLVNFLPNVDQAMVTLRDLTYSLTQRVDTTIEKDTAYSAINFSGSPGTADRCVVYMDNCSGYASVAYNLQQKWPIDMSLSGNTTAPHAFKFYAKNCRWNNLNPVVYGDLANNNSFVNSTTQTNPYDEAVFDNCTRTIVSNANIKQIDISNVSKLNNSANLDYYRQDNILLQSNYAPWTGTNIAPASPWVMTGSSSTLSSIANLNSFSVNPLDITPFGKRIIIPASSGLYQDITGAAISKPYSSFVTYDASISVSDSGSLYISLQNSVTGKIYGQTLLLGTTTATYRKYRVQLVAFVPAFEPGNLRLVQKDSSSSHQVILDVFYQNVSKDFKSEFVPTGSSVTEDTLSYNNIVENQKVFNWDIEPYKNDTVPSSSEFTAAHYLSNQTFFHRWYTDRWENTPRQMTGSAIPTSGTWPRGFIVWNSFPTSQSNIGWICTTGGTPGTWTLINDSSKYIQNQSSSTAQSASFNINGTAQIQGLTTLAGGLNLLGILPPPSTYKILVHGLTDSSTYAISSSTFLSGANNGLTNNSGTIQLGGNLNQNTTINTTGSFQYIIGNGSEYRVDLTANASDAGYDMFMRDSAGANQYWVRIPKGTYLKPLLFGSSGPSWGATVPANSVLMNNTGSAATTTWTNAPNFGVGSVTASNFVGAGTLGVTNGGLGGTATLVSGNDVAGVLQWISSSLTAQSGSIIIANPGVNYLSSSPSIIITPHNAAATALMPFIFAGGNSTSFTIQLNTITLASGTTYQFNYFVAQ